MLSLPSKGFHRSVGRHNVDFGICCDWLEASVLFCQEQVSGTDIVDLLRENEIYKEQDFAWELINNVFSGIRARSRLLGEGYPISIPGANRISAADAWERYPAYSFCLALSLSAAYPSWAKSFGSDFTRQGELFESLTAQSVTRAFVDWRVHATGWTRTATNRLATVVAEVAALLGEATGELERWTSRSAKEAGLDLLCYRPFPDGRVGIPVYLLQCASGGDWKQKLKTPDMRTWTKIVTFASDPKKAFSIPYTLEEAEFTQHTNVVDGLLLDRDRLLTPGFAARDWLTEDLAADLIAWISPRVATLPHD